MRTFSGDGDVVAVARESDVVVLESKSWKERSVTPVAGPVEQLQLSLNGEYLLATSSNTARLVDTRAGKVLLERSVREPVPTYAHATFAPNGRWLALATVHSDPDADANEDQVELIELPSLRTLARVKQPESFTPLPRPKFKPRVLPPSKPVGPGNPIGAVPNEAPRWDTDTLETNTRSVQDMSAAPSSERLLVEWSAGAVTVVDTASGSVRAESIAMSSTATLNRYGFSPSGRFIAIPRPSGAVALFDLERGSGKLFYDPLCPGSVGNASFDHAEQRVVLGGWTFSACVVDLEHAKLITLLPPNVPPSGPFEDEGMRTPGPWSKDDTQLVVADLAGQPVLWNLATGIGTPVGVDMHSARQTLVRPKDGSLAFLGELSRPLAELLGQRPDYFPVQDSDGMAMASSPDGEWVLDGLEPPLVLRATRRGAGSRELADAAAGGYEFDPSSRFVFTTDGAFQVWRVRDGARAFGTPPLCRR